MGREKEKRRRKVDEIRSDMHDEANGVCRYLEAKREINLFKSPHR